MITEEQVMDVLKTCQDPEIPISIVDLGLIYGVDIDNENKKINVRMTLTTPACPMYGQIMADVKQKVENAIDSEVNVEMVWNPPWTPDKMSPEARTKIGL